jgi:hypothetical protein
MGSAIPLCRWPLASAVRFSFDGRRRPHLSDQHILSSSSAFLQSVAQRTLVGRPQPADSSLGLPLPFSTCRTQRSTCTGDSTRPLRSVRRVWLPSRRLTPSESGPAFFHAGSALGIWPFGAFSTRKVSPAFSPARRPPAVCSRRLFPPPKRRAGPTGRGSWVLTLSSVPGGRRGLARRPLDAPLGFTLLGLPGREPCLGFPRRLPHAFPRRSSRIAAAASRSFDRLSPGPARSGLSPAGGGTTLAGFAHLARPRHSNASTIRAIFFTACRVVHYCRPADMTLDG